MYFSAVCQRQYMRVQRTLTHYTALVPHCGISAVIVWEKQEMEGLDFFFVEQGFCLRKTLPESTCWLSPIFCQLISNQQRGQTENRPDRTSLELEGHGLHPDEMIPLTVAPCGEWLSGAKQKVPRRQETNSRKKALTYDTRQVDNGSTNHYLYGWQSIPVTPVTTTYCTYQLPSQAYIPVTTTYIPVTLTSIHTSYPHKHTYQLPLHTYQLLSHTCIHTTRDDPIRLIHFRYRYCRYRSVRYFVLLLNK